VSVAFDVEQAGCESCGKLISTALNLIGTVESIEIDEESDTAKVVLSGDAQRAAVDTALEEVSAAAGHRYRVRADSWCVVT
jgi:copper chaperone CopZ